MDSKELWKKSEQYLNVEISSLGRVKRPIGKTKKNVIISEFPKDKDGYYRVSVQKLDGIWTSMPVHRLVAITFIDNPENKKCVNHKDSNRNNNNVENLEWVTHKENVYHSYQFGKRTSCKKISRQTLLTDFQISQIDKLREIYTLNQLANLFNIEYQSMKNIIIKKKKYERLDDQQPSNYKSIYN